VLLGNIAASLIRAPRLDFIVGLLALCIAAAAMTPVSALLSLESRFVQAAAAVAVFLGPIFFASIIFASLIREEKNFYRAYGSNVLGAVLGGVCEYTSLMFGFKMLLGVALVFYLAVYLLIKAERVPVTVRSPG
jgi:hypothetical protein